LPDEVFVAMNLPVFEVPTNGSVLQNLFVAFVALLFSQAAASPLKALESSGLFPFVLRLSVFGGRLVAAMAFVASFFLLMPVSLVPAVPWVLVAAGVALGWSARDMLRDLLAASVLLLERRIRPGVRLKTDHHSGIVTRMGFRAVFIDSDSGVELGLPNRIFLSQSYSLDEDPHLPMEIRLRIRSKKSTDHIRDALIEMALFSPFIAPGHRPEAVRDSENSEIWLLKCRLLSTEFLNAFEGAIEEQIEAGLETSN
jgi:small-conductance mechanosensitive channel